MRLASPRTQLAAVLGVLALGALTFTAQEADAGVDAAGNTLVASPQLAKPFTEHVVVQTTPTVIPAPPNASMLTLYNLGTSQVCCTWTLPDGGGLLPDAGGAPVPVGGPTPCMLDVQASATSTPIPGVARWNVIGGKTVACDAAAAQSTDGGDLRVVVE